MSKQSRNFLLTTLFTILNLLHFAQFSHAQVDSDNVTFQEIEVSDGYAYVTTDDDRLFVIDVTDPLTPTFIASYSISGISEKVFDVSNGVLYYTTIVGDESTRWDGFSMVDVSDPLQFKLIGTHQMRSVADDLSSVDTLSAGGGYIAVNVTWNHPDDISTGFNLYIFDTSIPSNIKELNYIYANNDAVRPTPYNLQVDDTAVSFIYYNDYRNAPDGQVWSLPDFQRLPGFTDVYNLKRNGNVTYAVIGCWTVCGGNYDYRELKVYVNNEFDESFVLNDGVRISNIIEDLAVSFKDDHVIVYDLSSIDTGIVNVEDGVSIAQMNVDSIDYAGSVAFIVDDGLINLIDFSRNGDIGVVAQFNLSNWITSSSLTVNEEHHIFLPLVNR